MVEKKIYFVCSALYGGGAERVIINLSGYFVKHGYEFTFVPVRYKDIAYEVPLGVKVDYTITNKTMSPVSRIMTVRKHMKSHGNCIYMSFLPLDNLFMLMSGLNLDIKKVISIRNYPLYDFTSMSHRWLLLKFRNLLYRSSDLIVSQTRAQSDFLEKNNVHSHACIPNPILSDLPKPRKSFEAGKLVAVGRLEKQKNYDMMIDVMEVIIKERPDVKLHIYGRGHLLPSLKDKVKNKGLCNNIIFEGFSDNVINEIRDSQCFLMTSLYEGQPNALIEALALGIPCVVTNSQGGAANELVNDGVNGYVVDRRSISMFADKVLNVLDSDRIQDMACESSSKLRSSLSLEHIGLSWIDVFESNL